LILDEIIESKRREVADAKRRDPIEKLRERVTPRESGRFRRAIGEPGRLNLIAEIKKASPSRGVIRADFDPTAIARSYADGGVSAISVLTDTKYFQGDVSYLVQARKESGLPVLRKDFIIDEHQIWETATLDADALLLIVAALDTVQLKDYLQLAGEVGLDALVEAHDAAEIEAALEAGAGIVGINNRDLRTFETDIETTLRLAEQIPKDRVIVSESGIHTREDAQKVRDAGANAILVGEALMTCADISGKIRELTGD
jgi:indole-3-glycerol phosphate synthase